MSLSSGNDVGIEAGRVFEGAHNITLVCSFCGKWFSGNRSNSGVRSNYRRHLLTHTHERPYKCRYCAAGFTTKPNMRRHVRALHPQMVDLSDSAQTVGGADGVAPLHDMTNAEEINTEVPRVLHSPTPTSENVHPNLESLAMKATPCPFSLSLTSLQPQPRELSPRDCSLSEGEAKGEGCHYCGRRFSCLAIRLLHERRCAQRKGLQAVEMERETRRPYLAGEFPDPVDFPATSSKGTSRSVPKGRIASDALLQSLLVALTPKRVFICEDCELEVSSRSKLRRHQRYYCPFRDDVQADPLAEVLIIGDAPSQAHRGVGETDSEAECAHVHQLAEQVGLKFVSNANTSSSSSEGSVKEGKDVFGSASEEEDEEAFAWGYVSTVDTSSSVSLERALGGRSSSEREGKDDGAESQSGEESLLGDQIHLDFKRRRSGNKRARRILLKRIRAQQRKLQVDSRKSTQGGAKSPDYLFGNEESGSIQARASAEVCESFYGKGSGSPNTSAWQLPIAGSSLESSNKGRKFVDPRSEKLLLRDNERADESGNSDVFGSQLSLGLRCRAEALANSSSKGSAHYSYVCPFDGCLGRFSKQRYWLAHAARCHPVEWVKHQKRLRTEEDKQERRE